ncbi:MAG: Thioredoxin [Candidatus Roizmanbacteria bacterium GW2011_GWA2_36_23]|uniref:Thioredoxin n=1 Tax=Candidatus Roizmanbacteria bacterium GW2011_GWA2_36_23 TaxID=1618480 RepID=A0A0G0E7Q4_9BACT|nr:MAG: Thioredoxin [Candidatus Roizmanbacteria bacterium GW2011_GWA2_36_23]
MAIKHVSKEEFQKEVIEHKGPVLVDFYAEWCGPCKTTSPILDELSSEIKNMKFVKIDVDKNPDLASSYSVFSIPTFLIVKDGTVVAQFIGAIGKEGFLQEINKVLDSYSS